MSPIASPCKPNNGLRLCDRNSNRFGQGWDLSTVRRLSFEELDQRTSSIAVGLRAMGMRPGHRIAMAVPFGADFIALVFALLKTGVTLILIDPGMGAKERVALSRVDRSRWNCWDRESSVRAMVDAFSISKSQVECDGGTNLGLLASSNACRLGAFARQ